MTYGVIKMLLVVQIVELKSRVISKVRSRSRSNILIKSHLDLLELVKN